MTSQELRPTNPRPPSLAVGGSACSPAHTTPPPFTLRPGTLSDWALFAHAHFRPNRPVAPRGIWIAYARVDSAGRRRPAAIVVYSYPPLASAARNVATDRAYVPTSATRSETARRINRDFTTLCRLVTLPDHRHHGLPLWLLTKTLPLVGTPFVEAFTVIGRSLCFFTAAGFHMSKPPHTPVRLRVLRTLEHNPLPLACLRSTNALAAHISNPPSPQQRRTAAAILRWAYEHARSGTSGGPNPDPHRAAWLYLHYFNNQPWYALWSKEAHPNET